MVFINNFINMLFFTFSALVICLGFCECAYEIKLYHYIDGAGVRSERGTVTVHNADSNDVTFKQDPLTQADIHKIKSLADKGDFYRMDVVIKQNNKKEVTLSTFAKACALIESKLSDVFSVYLDHLGNPVGVSLSTSESYCYGHTVLDSELKSFHSSMYFQTPENGPAPDTLSYIQKMDRDRESRERGGTKDNRSFLAKYWMYLVPMAIFLVVSGAAAPAEGGNGGSGR